MKKLNTEYRIPACFAPACFELRSESGRSQGEAGRQNTEYGIQNTEYKHSRSARKGFTRQNFSKKNLVGFTLMELLVVIAITTILSGVGVSTYINQQRAKLLDNTAQEIVGYLRYAQQKSMAQEQGKQWGVHFENPTEGQDFYALYSGAAYSSPEETRYLSSGIEYETPTAGNSIDVSFNRLTGISATSTTQSITIKSTVTNSTTTISIFGQGLISY